jgi:hypothetical protein
VHYGRLIRYEDAIHPLSNAPEPKRRFVPSKWEHKTVVKMVRAIRNGNLKLGCVCLPMTDGLMDSAVLAAE